MFSVVGLAAGSYKVAFNRASGLSLAEAQFYNNKPESAGAGAAQTVTVGASGSVSNINATLVTGGSIAGTLTDKAGKPLPTAGVQAYTRDGSLVTRSGTTDAGGKFNITGLSTGKYFVVAHSGADGSKIYSGNVATEASAVQVIVASRPSQRSRPRTPRGAATLTAPTPTVTGAAKVGEKLTAVPGTWGPAPVTLAYQWRANKGVIAGATAATYAGTSDLGKTITVTVTGSKAGYTTTAKTTAATPIVMAANPVLTAPVPTISGTSRVGSALTAGPGTWGPAPVALAYQWRANNTVITGATASTYKPLAADLGKTITVTVTGSKAGYTTTAKTSPATPIVMAANPVLTAPVPTISGTSRVGSALTAGPGTWGPAPVALAYQWRANNAVITGATASTYKPLAADLGKTITVTVTGSKAGYTTTAKTSPATPIVMAANPVLTAPVPTITGAAKVGSTLTAVPGTWGPAPVGLAYQWRANGIAITGATAGTYRPAAADLGKTITVTVTGSKAGYTTAAKTSAATAKVAAGVLSASVPTISGTARVGSTLSAVPRTWGPAPVTLRYQWRANGIAITGQRPALSSRLLRTSGRRSP